MQDQPAAATHGNQDDAEYEAFLTRVRTRFAGLTAGGNVPLFTTDAPNLWLEYLEGFTDEIERQFHSCNACHHFIRRYGSLVLVDENSGTTTPAIWDRSIAPTECRRSVAAMEDLVRRARVTGVFLSSELVWGYPKTGAWRHLHVHGPSVYIGTPELRTAGQAMAAKREEYKGLLLALAAFPAPVVDQTVKLLESNVLHRGDKVLPAATWLRELHRSTMLVNGAAKGNLVWRAVATAPAGFAHVRSSLLGSLLEDVKAGMATHDIRGRFNAKMDTYQRPTAAPRAGQIDAAERAVEALRIAPAFARRYAAKSDLLDHDAVLWLPSEHVPQPADGVQPTAQGVFAHLRPAEAATPGIAVPPKVMTWEKFARDVLPGAAAIEYRVPLVGRFCALTAAQDPDAPPILQWDRSDHRNTISWSFPNPAARADEWNLQAGTLARVPMILRSPNVWDHDHTSQHAHHGEGVFLLLAGARDLRGVPGGGLFPEHLRGDLRPYRSTIEAHLNRATVEGADRPDTAAFGIGLFAGGSFTETAAAAVAAATGTTGPAPERIHIILVLDDSGSMREHLRAAQQAVASLAASMRAMPGRVDVTVIRFGSHASTLMDRVDLRDAEGIERSITGGSGGTALNDTLHATISRALLWEDAYRADTSFFLGIVTDGKDEGSRTHSPFSVRQVIQQAQGTGRWTIAFAGAAGPGYYPAQYAESIGIPRGNVKVFEASARGFEEAGASYASSTRTLASSYSQGARASTSFFAAAAGSREIGSDLPVLEVTSKTGDRTAYQLDRWE